MAIAASYPTIKPSLLLDFANAKAVDPRITFTRSTTAKYYDGVTTAKAEENLLLQSQAFDNAAWTNASITVSANSTVAPDGTTTADTATRASTGELSQSPAVTNGQTYTVSVFAKAGTGNFLQVALGVGGFTANDWANFDLNAGVVGNKGSSATSSIQSIGSGWYRCIMTCTAVATQTSSFAFCPLDADTASRKPTNSVSASNILWGAQLEARSSVTAYTPTTTQPITNYIPVLQTAAAGVPRIDHDPVTGECLGLLIEEQRTNLLTWSESFRTQTLAVTGVSGTFVDGETVTATGGGTGIYVLAESTGSSFAIFNGSGTFTGTLTGGTSGATATISSSVANWTMTDVTVSANQVVAPDGALAGDKLIPNTSNAVHRAFIGLLGSAGANTVSAYMKKGEYTWGVLRIEGVNSFFNLDLGTVGTVGAGNTATITHVGNGWYRCTTTRTTAGSTISTIGVASADNTDTFTGDGYSGIYIWGAQLEAGAFPTSYIPTTSTQQTRNADAASMTGTNFSSWYRQDEGSFYSSVFARGYTLNQMLFSATDGTIANPLQAYFDSASQIQTNAWGNGLVNRSAAINTQIKYAVGFAVNNVSVTIGGGAATTDTTAGPVHRYTQFNIGNRNGSLVFNGTIKKIAYYPQRLTNANLQALTA